MYKFVLIFLSVFFSVFSTFGQNVAKQIKKAEANSKNYAFANAIEIYENLLKKPKNLEAAEFQTIKLNLGDAYYLVKDYKNAEKHYSEILLLNPILKGDELKSLQKFAQVLSSNGKHQESSKIWQKYTELQEQDKRGVEFSKLYNNLEPLTRNASSYRIEYVGINTNFPDFSPAFYKDGLVFVSSRNKNNSVKRVFKWDNSSFLDLYYLEDLKILGKEESAASIGSGGQTPDERKGKPSPDKLGDDYYTPPTPNDANTIGHQGSDLINGSKNYEENSIIDVKFFSKNINSKYHEGPCAFFHDGTKIVFTRNGNSGGDGIFGQKKEGITRLKLYSADKKGNDWSNIKELPFNDNDFSCGHPTINYTDKILYFISDMPGGYGGTDIYMARFINGTWGKPINLGGKINTIGNEMFPFVDEGGGLYFSSDGHPGLGDLDMFYISTDLLSNMPNGKIKNLGAPINSNNDDFGIITDKSRNIGYFSSNRKRGGADDDIYKFTRIGNMYGCRDLIVNVFDNKTKNPLDKSKFEYFALERKNSIENATTNLQGSIKLCLEAENEFNFNFSKPGYITQNKKYTNFDASDFEPSILNIYLEPEKKGIEVATVATEKPRKNRILEHRRSSSNNSNVFRGVINGGENGEPISAVKVRFINKCTGEVQEMYTKKDGSYEFRRDLECDYELIASKDDFGLSSEIIEKAIKKTFFGRKKKIAVPLNLFDTKLYKVGDVIRLENIYYDSESYKFKDYAKKELDKLVTTLKRYPNMIIEISSHTDTRGSAVDNMRLSQLRVNEVYKYVMSKNIPKNRIKAIGKGESNPLNSCSDGVQCTEAEHQRNRRTEFKILTIEKI
jgi:outer membrane protein OmpA-like peptidoglycan-associated protein/tetratricopeptide (TPR) repeat protein